MPMSEATSGLPRDRPARMPRDLLSEASEAFDTSEAFRAFEASGAFMMSKTSEAPAGVVRPPGRRPRSGPETCAR
ncbi:hypothetical protein GCM10018952_08080 [Streptosporangium vulgare]